MNQPSGKRLSGEDKWKECWTLNAEFERRRSTHRRQIICHCMWVQHCERSYIWMASADTTVAVDKYHTRLNKRRTKCVHRFIVVIWKPKYLTVINWWLWNARDYLVGILKLHLKDPIIDCVTLRKSNRLAMAISIMTPRAHALLFSAMFVCVFFLLLFSCFICNNHLGSVRFGWVFRLNSNVFCIDVPVSSSHAEHIFNATGGPMSAIKLLLLLQFPHICTRWLFAHPLLNAPKSQRSERKQCGCKCTRRRH